MCLPPLATSGRSHVLYYLLVGLVLLVVGSVVLVEAARVLQVVCMFGTRGSMLTTMTMLTMVVQFLSTHTTFSHTQSGVTVPLGNEGGDKSYVKSRCGQGLREPNIPGGIPTTTYCATTVQVGSWWFKYGFLTGYRIANQSDFSLPWVVLTCALVHSWRLTDMTQPP